MSRKDVSKVQEKTTSILTSIGLVALAAYCGIMDARNALHAATATGTLTVQMTVTAGCTVNGGTIDFGSNAGSALLATALSITSSISVQCTTGAPYAVGLDAGQNANGSQRRMSNGSGGFINYSLSTDALGLNNWLGATNSTTCSTALSCVLSTGTGLLQSIPIYARIPLLATSPAPGAYTDVVTITVTY